MSNIRNTGITDKRGFRYTCYVATSTQNLKDFRNYMDMFTYYGHIKAKILILLAKEWAEFLGAYNSK